MTMLPRVKGIPYGLTKLPTHNYIVSIAFLVHCCVGLFADSPPSQYFDTNSIFSIILWGYPIYIYMCMCVLRVPYGHNASVHICVCVSNLFFVLHLFYVNFLTVLLLFYVNYLTIRLCMTCVGLRECYASACNVCLLYTSPSPRD